MKNIYLFFILISLSSYAWSGGYDFEIKYVSFIEKGSQEYKIKFIPLSAPLKNNIINKEIIIHLRYKTDEKYVTKKHYIESINLLKNNIKNSKLNRFGRMGWGYKKIKGTLNEYQSNALKVYDGVVYSHHN